MAANEISDTVLPLQIIRQLIIDGFASKMIDDRLPPVDSRYAIEYYQSIEYYQRLAEQCAQIMVLPNDPHKPKDNGNEISHHQYGDHFI